MNPGYSFLGSILTGFQKLYKTEYLRYFFDFFHSVGHQMHHEHVIGYFKGHNDLKTLHGEAKFAQKILVGFVTVEMTDRE